MGQDWDIKPRSDVCQACQQAFQDKDAYFSALMFGQEGYARADYHAACWPSVQASAAPYSQWQGIYRLPPPAAEEPLKKETAESLLRKLMEEENPENGNVIYILAVMLERSKTFVEQDVQSREDGSLLRVYEHRKTGETFLIPDPGLRLDQLEPVQEQVMAMLGGPSRKKADEAPPASSDQPPQT